MSEMDTLAEGSSSSKRPDSSGSPAPPPKRERAKGGGSSLDPTAWMVTFSDLLTLLMTFFILLFAAADPVPPKKLQEAFGQTTGVFGAFRRGFLEKIMVTPRQDISQDLVQVFLTEIGALDIEVLQDERGLVMVLPTDTFFRPGGVTLNRKARRRIDQLAAFLKDTGHRIRVEGHSDNRERPKGRVRSRWQLSLARANRVLERLVVRSIPEARLSLVGYGPAKPRFKNLTRKGRAGNRRVELVIVKRGGKTK
jgi:chemotaxis protein MotB